MPGSVRRSWAIRGFTRSRSPALQAKEIEASLTLQYLVGKCPPSARPARGRGRQGTQKLAVQHVGRYPEHLQGRAGTMGRLAVPMSITGWGN